MKKFRYQGTFITGNIFECTCQDFSHTFKIEIMKNGPNDEDEEFIVEVGLDETAGFFKRIVTAVKYIFTGRASRWDRIMKRQDMIRLQRQLEAHFGTKSNRKVRK